MISSLLVASLLLGGSVFSTGDMAPTYESEFIDRQVNSYMTARNGARLHIQSDTGISSDLDIPGGVMLSVSGVLQRQPEETELKPGDKFNRVFHGDVTVRVRDLSRVNAELVARSGHGIGSAAVMAAAPITMSFHDARVEVVVRRTEVPCSQLKGD